MCIHILSIRRAYEGPSNPEEEIQKMISDVDDDGSGTIGYEEPLGYTLLIEPLVRPRGQLKKAQRLSACLRFLKMMTHKILNRDPPPGARRGSGPWALILMPCIKWADFGAWWYIWFGSTASSHNSRC